MLADVDRMVVGENAGLECKTASPYVAYKWEDGKIPLSYQLQCYNCLCARACVGLCLKRQVHQFIL